MHFTPACRTCFKRTCHVFCWGDDAGILKLTDAANNFEHTAWTGSAYHRKIKIDHVCTRTHFLEGFRLIKFFHRIFSPWLNSSSPRGWRQACLFGLLRCPASLLNSLQDLCMEAINVMGEGSHRAGVHTQPLIWVRKPLSNLEQDCCGSRCPPHNRALHTAPAVNRTKKVISVCSI